MVFEFADAVCERNGGFDAGLGGEYGPRCTARIAVWVWFADCAGVYYATRSPSTGKVLVLYRGLYSIPPGSSWLTDDCAGSGDLQGRAKHSSSGMAGGGSIWYLDATY